MRRLRGARTRVTRKPPRPRWHRHALLGGILAIACTLAGTLGWWVVESDMPGKAGQQILRMIDTATRSAGLEVKEVHAVGRLRTKSGDIRDKLENIYGQNILLVDISEVRKQLETLPWIRSASVRRLLPDGLRLQLEERRPMAVWRDPRGEPWLIDEHGEAIDVAVLEAFSGLPVITGSGARGAAAELFGLLIEEPELARRVSGAQLVDERRWNIFLDGHVEVRLPSDRVAKAWSLLARTDRETSLLQRAVESVDLRNPDWLIVRLMDEATSGREGRSA